MKTTATSGRVSRKAAVLAVAKKKFRVTPRNIVKANSMDEKVFVYALRRTSIRFAVLFDDTFLPSGYEWRPLGSHGNFQVFYTHNQSINLI